MWCTGYNPYGQLGDGSTTSRTTVVQVSNLSNVLHMAAGNGLYSVLATTTANETYAWGRNYQGCLGIGNSNTQTYTTPQRINGF